MAIVLENVSYRYDTDDATSNELGIFNISMSIENGQTIGIIGHTGSGKSTLMQHLNGLYLPQKGRIIIDNFILDKDAKGLKELRKKVGMVFQYPEDQLFEESIYNDIAFGPKNMGLKDDLLDQAVRSAMEDMELDFETMKERSPYDLSGGQKRKVAIATVLAMNPEILVLDEPTAGLDPKSKTDLLNLLFSMKKKRALTVFFVSHNMDDIYRFSDYVYVLNYGRIAMEGTPKEIFSQGKVLKELGLGVPYSVELLDNLHRQGLYKGSLSPLSLEDLTDVLYGLVRRPHD